MRRIGFHTLALLSAFLYLSSATAAEKKKTAENLLYANPNTPAATVERDSRYYIAGRSLASVNASQEANEALLKSIKPGSKLLIQNSIRDWNDELVTVTDIFEDGSVRVKLSSGQRAFIRFDNLAHNLSSPEKCGKAHGVEICVGDEVYYPATTTSFEIPKGKVNSVFSNGTAIVRDGLDFVFDLKQLGKEEECSPKKPSICEGTYVYAEGYRNRSKFTFEGNVVKTYSNGVVIVQSGIYRFPIAAEGVKKRIAGLTEEMNPAVVTSTVESKPYLPLEERPGDYSDLKREAPPSAEKLSVPEVETWQELPAPAN